MDSFSCFKNPTRVQNRTIYFCKREFSFISLAGMEDDENIQQITESIRKHAQRRKAAKVL